MASPVDEPSGVPDSLNESRDVTLDENEEPIGIPINLSFFNELFYQ